MDYPCVNGREWRQRWKQGGYLHRTEVIRTAPQERQVEITAPCVLQVRASLSEILSRPLMSLKITQNLQNYRLVFGGVDEFTINKMFRSRDTLHVGGVSSCNLKREFNNSLPPAGNEPLTDVIALMRSEYFFSVFPLRRKSFSRGFLYVIFCWIRYVEMLSSHDSQPSF